MRIWLKYLLGCALGIVMSIILQGTNENAIKIVENLSTLALRTGKFALVPLLFFAMTVAVCELRENKKLLKTAVYVVGITIVTTLGLTLLGLLTVLIIQPPRIPISVEEVSQVYTLDIWANILKLFPESNMQSFIDGAFYLPLFILAGFAGAGCASDKTAAKPTLTLFNSLTHVCYSVVSFFIDMFAICLIAISCTWMLDFPQVASSSPLLFLVLLVAGIALVVVAVIYPIILRLLFRERHPYRVLYACIASFVTAFFTQDYNVTLSVNFRHARESLGIDSKVSSVSLPIFSTFARGGIAMCLTVSFIVILKSYSDMGITSYIPWIVITAFVLSFLLGALPREGFIVALAVMCSAYGRGFENGYLIIKPAAFFLCSIATLIDAATAIFGTYYIASKEKMLKHREVKFYI